MNNTDDINSAARVAGGTIGYCAIRPLMAYAMRTAVQTALPTTTAVGGLCIAMATEQAGYWAFQSAQRYSWNAGVKCAKAATTATTFLFNQFKRVLGQHADNRAYRELSEQIEQDQRVFLVQEATVSQQDQGWYLVDERVEVEISPRQQTALTNRSS